MVKNMLSKFLKLNINKINLHHLVSKFSDFMKLLVKTLQKQCIQNPWITHEATEKRHEQRKVAIRS